jgi:hypothetical protein
MTPKPTTADLIRQLASSPAPQPFRTAKVAVGVLAVIGVMLAVFWSTFGLRADLASAWHDLPVQAKSLLPLLLSGVAIWLALGSSRPEARIRLWPLAVPLVLGLYLVVQRIGQATGPIPMIEAVNPSAIVCLSAVTLLSVLPLGLGVVMLRRAAPVRPGLTGALLGLAVGAGIAAGYALYCTEDSPLFFMLWYSLAIGIVAGCGAILGQRFLRW